MTRPTLDLLHGTVDLLVLRTLAWEPMHGYAIGQFVKTRTDGAIALDSAALYPALHRLERKGLLEESWGVSETGREAKYYKLTPAGRRQLRAEAARWRQYADSVTLALDAAEK